jgi:anti-sigma factor RsiW
MQCSEYSELMSLELDDLLDETQSTRFHGHVAQCDSCRAEWEALRRLSSALESEPLLWPASGFSDRVAVRLREREVRRRQVKGGLGLVAGSMGLWSILALVLGLAIAVIWQPLLHLVWVDAVLPLLRSAADILVLLGRALNAVVREVFTRPTWLVLPGYVLTALGLVVLWTWIVSRQRRHWVGVNARFE